MTIFTLTDQKAIAANDNAYLNAKGAEHYKNGDYATAIKFYHLAAAMGDDQAMSNLGYCYLYGRDVEKDIELAMAYFEMAAAKNNVYALYKLGDIYSSDKYIRGDEEAMLWYYRRAAVAITGYEELRDFAIEKAYDGESDFVEHPSLALGIAKYLIGKYSDNVNMERAFIFLCAAKKGYEYEISTGSAFYEESLGEVMRLLADERFEEIKRKREALEAEES